MSNGDDAGHIILPILFLPRDPRQQQLLLRFLSSYKALIYC